MFSVFFRNADQLTIGDELLVQGNNELVPTKALQGSLVNCWCQIHNIGIINLTG